MTDHSRDRTVYLGRLRPPEDRPPGALTDGEIMELTRRGIVRSSHYLWLAEQYMMDVAKLGQGDEFDGRVAQLGGVCRYVEEILSEMLRP